MSTIAREFTKEQLQQIIETDHVQCGEASSLARIALASLEAEPVAWLLSGGGAKNHVSFDSGNAYADPLREVTPLYTASPAPVSVPAAMEMDDDFDSAFEHGKAVGWNAYRAAMLQAEPVSNSDELPLDYLQGHKDGLEWAAQLAEANHPQTGDWLYDDPIDLARAIRKGPDMPTVQGGNSPVTPDGWISCSDRMPVIGELNWRTSFPLLITCEIGVIPAYYGFVSVNGDRHYGFMESLKYGDDSGNHPQTNEYGLISNVTHWMPLPEPQQEVNHG